MENLIYFICCSRCCFPLPNKDADVSPSSCSCLPAASCLCFSCLVRLAASWASWSSASITFRLLRSSWISLSLRCTSIRKITLPSSASLVISATAVLVRTSMMDATCVPKAEVKGIPPRDRPTHSTQPKEEFKAKAGASECRVYFRKYVGGCDVIVAEVEFPNNIIYLYYFFWKRFKKYLLLQVHTLNYFNYLVFRQCFFVCLMKITKVPNELLCTRFSNRNSPTKWQTHCE